MKVVLDTNVLVSGFISPKGTPARVIGFWKERIFTLVVSEDILSEVKRVLNYKKIKTNYRLSLKEIDNYLRGLRVFSEVCKPKKKIEAIKVDLADNMFLEAAYCSGAKYVVSGDEHLLKLGSFKEIEILKPKAFINVIEKLIKQ